MLTGSNTVPICFSDTHGSFRIRACDGMPWVSIQAWVWAWLCADQCSMKASWSILKTLCRPSSILNVPWVCQCESTYLDETLLWAILTATVRCKVDTSLAVFAHLHAARSTRGREPQWIMMDHAPSCRAIQLSVSWSVFQSVWFDKLSDEHGLRGRLRLLWIGKAIKFNTVEASMWCWHTSYIISSFLPGNRTVALIHQFCRKSST